MHYRSDEIFLHFVFEKEFLVLNGCMNIFSQFGIQIPPSGFKSRSRCKYIYSSVHTFYKINYKNLENQVFLSLKSEYSEVSNRRADQNNRGGLEKNANLLSYLLSKSINEQGGIFSFITRRIVSRVERKSEKIKQACFSIRDFRVTNMKLKLSKY